MGPRPSSLGTWGRSAAVGLSVVAVGMLAAGCGSSSPPTGRAGAAAAPLLQDSAAAFSKVPAVHIQGTITEKSGSATVSIGVDATSSGATGTAAGTLDLAGPGLGFTGSTHYVVIGGTTYVNAGTAFWKSLFGTQTPSVVHLEGEILPEVLDKWVQLPSASTDVVYKDTFGLSEPKVFVEGTLEGAKGTLTNAGNQKIGGVSGVEIDSSKGARILVAATGSPLPLAFANSQSGSSDFALDLAITYPASSKITAPPHPISLAGIEAALSK